MKATNIQWDIDEIDEEDLEEDTKSEDYAIALPTEIKIPDGMTDKDEISDYLSEQTGFCHFGFELVEE